MFLALFLETLAPGTRGRRGWAAPNPGRAWAQVAYCPAHRGDCATAASGPARTQNQNTLEPAGCWERSLHPQKLQTQRGVFTSQKASWGAHGGEARSGAPLHSLCTRWSPRRSWCPGLASTQAPFFPGCPVGPAALSAVWSCPAGTRRVRQRFRALQAEARSAARPASCGCARSERRPRARGTAARSWGCHVRVRPARSPAAAAPRTGGGGVGLGRRLSQQGPTTQRLFWGVARQGGPPLGTPGRNAGPVPRPVGLPAASVSSVSKSHTFRPDPLQ